MLETVKFAAATAAAYWKLEALVVLYIILIRMYTDTSLDDKVDGPSDLHCNGATVMRVDASKRCGDLQFISLMVWCVGWFTLMAAMILFYYSEHRQPAQVCWRRGGHEIHQLLVARSS